MPPNSALSRLILPILLLLVFWGSRIVQLDRLPLHTDEGIHIRTALMVYEGDPLWRVSNGKIIGHWPIALFQPQVATTFVSRMATIFVALLGAAAGYALLKRAFGRWAAAFGTLFWLTSPFMFFFERTALMDAQTGALVVLTLWAGLLYLRQNRLWQGILTGLLLLAAILYKLTAAPALASLGLLLLCYGDAPLRQRLRQILVVGLTLAVCVAIPLPYVLPRVLGGSGGAGLGSFSTAIAPARIRDNLVVFVHALSSFGTLLRPMLFATGLWLLEVLRRKQALLLILAPLPLMMAIVVFSSNIYYRYVAAVLPLWLLLAGAGLGVLIMRLTWRPVAALSLIAGLTFSFLPFALTAYSAPGELPLPEFMRLQYITEHSSGFGLREAAQALPETITRPELQIIGSMFNASCRRTNYYAPTDHQLVCTDALGVAEIEAALQAQGAVYVLADRPPFTGIDISTIDGEATRIAAYPRPGDPADQPAITLWLVERPGLPG